MKGHYLIILSIIIIIIIITVDSSHFEPILYMYACTWWIRLVVRLTGDTGATVEYTRTLQLIQTCHQDKNDVTKKERRIMNVWVLCSLFMNACFLV